VEMEKGSAESILVLSELQEHGILARIPHRGKGMITSFCPQRCPSRMTKMGNMAFSGLTTNSSTRPNIAIGRFTRVPRCTASCPREDLEMLTRVFSTVIPGSHGGINSRPPFRTCPRHTPPAAGTFFSTNVVF